MMGQKLGHKILAWPSRDHIKASFIIIMNVTLRSCLPRSLKDKQLNANDKITKTGVRCFFRGNSVGKK